MDARPQEMPNYRPGGMELYILRRVKCAFLLLFRKLLNIYCKFNNILLIPAYEIYPHYTESGMCLLTSSISSYLLHILVRAPPPSQLCVVLKLGDSTFNSLI